MLKINWQRGAEDPAWIDFLKILRGKFSDLGGDIQFELNFGQRVELNVQSQSLSLKKAFFLDFAADKLIWRISHSGRHSEAVARAVLGKEHHPVVFDATAGLGRDAFILQCCGAMVTMFERSPVIWALLFDALQRASKDEKFISSLPNGLPKLAPFGSLIDHVEMGSADVVYYDPMFPQRQKSALVKQEMRILHAVVGGDEDADLMLPLLLKRATKRVVVKRPAGSVPLAVNLLRPSGATDGKACRFDIYFSESDQI